MNAESLFVSNTSLWSKGTVNRPIRVSEIEQKSGILGNNSSTCMIFGRLGISLFGCNSLQHSLRVIYHLPIASYRALSGQEYRLREAEYF
jgi:hypothetical protein